MKKLFTMLPLLLAALILISSCTKPDAAAGGVLSSFTSEDLAGNKVDQSILGGHKLTMVNIWATFCSPCIREMPDLGELHKEYADRGFQVIGIPADIANKKGEISQTLLDEAIEIINITKADYLHIVPSLSLYAAKISRVSSVPETIFVDEFGNQVGESYIGARSRAAWAAIIEQLLEEVG